MDEKTSAELNHCRVLISYQSFDGQEDQQHDKNLKLRGKSITFFGYCFYFFKLMFWCVCLYISSWLVLGRRFLVLICQRTLGSRWCRNVLIKCWCLYIYIYGYVMQRWIYVTVSYQMASKIGLTHDWWNNQYLWEITAFYRQ